MTTEETVLLGKKYRDPNRPGLCNYYSFHEDIERKQKGSMACSYVCFPSDHSEKYSIFLYSISSDWGDYMETAVEN